MRDGPRRVIAAADAAARAAGFYAGISVARAQSLVRDLSLPEAEPEQDREALHRLAGWIVPRFSPLVALDEPIGNDWTVQQCLPWRSVRSFMSGGRRALDITEN